MNEQNFLKRLDFLATGDGVIREVPIPISACLNASGTAVANVSGVLAWYAQDDNDSLTIPFKVPMDYDPALDELAVVLTAEETTSTDVSTTNYIELDLDVVGLVRPGGAAKTTLTPVSDSQKVALTVEEYAFDLSGLGVKPGDVLSIEIDAQETGTAETSVYAVSVKYRSNIVANDVRLRGVVTEVITND